MSNPTFSERLVEAEGGTPEAPPGAPWSEEDRFGRSHHLFRTGHLQGGGPTRIELLHLFLPFPPSASQRT